jgi:transcriptional regulator with XRE-family HTH domain
MNAKQIPEHQQKQLQKISCFLKELRINNYLTQLEVSKETGIHPNTLIRIENSKNFTLIKLLLLAELYQISPANLLSILD